MRLRFLGLLHKWSPKHILNVNWSHRSNHRGSQIVLKRCAEHGITIAELCKMPKRFRNYFATVPICPCIALDHVNEDSKSRNVTLVYAHCLLHFIGDILNCTGTLSFFSSNCTSSGRVGMATLGETPCLMCLLCAFSSMFHLLSTGKFACMQIKVFLADRVELYDKAFRYVYL